jgi:hypothetical protein
MENMVVDMVDMDIVMVENSVKVMVDNKWNMKIMMIVRQKGFLLDMTMKM